MGPSPDRPQDLVPRLPPRPLLRDRRITEHRRAEATRKRCRFRVSRETSVPRPARPDRARLMYVPVSLPSPSAFFKTLPETSTVHFSALPLLFPSTARTESVETDPARKFKLESVSARTFQSSFFHTHAHTSNTKHQVRIESFSHPLHSSPGPSPSGGDYGRTYFLLDFTLVSLQSYHHTYVTLEPQRTLSGRDENVQSKEWMDHSAVPSAETTDPAPLTSRLCTGKPECLLQDQKGHSVLGGVFFLISE